MSGPPSSTPPVGGPPRPPGQATPGRGRSAPGPGPPGQSPMVSSRPPAQGRASGGLLQRSPGLPPQVRGGVPPQTRPPQVRGGVPPQPRPPQVMGGVPLQVRPGSVPPASTGAVPKQPTVGRAAMALVSGGVQPRPGAPPLSPATAQQSTSSSSGPSPYVGGEGPGTAGGRATWRADHRPGVEVAPPVKAMKDLAIQDRGSPSSISMQSSKMDSSLSGASRARAAQRGRTETRGGGDSRFVLVTRPNEVAENKKGCSGYPAQLVSNYFRIIKKPDFHLYKFAVTFSPEEDNVKVRKRLVRDLEAQHGPMIFDGAQVWTTNKITQDKTVLETISKRFTYANNEKVFSDVKVTFTLVGEVNPTDIEYIQVLNLILRRALDALKLERVKRNMYDPKESYPLKEWKLEVWPGYDTSIMKCEGDNLMINVELRFKVLRTDTVSDIIKSFRKDVAKIERSLVGQIVMTRYNNKTYKIDGILWDRNAQHTFTRRGAQQSYVDYYRARWNLDIRVKNDPLLLCLMKVNPNDGQKEEETKEVHLVPELCYMTGYTDEMRKNFNLMKSLGNFTRQQPPERAQTLHNFAKRIHSTPEAIGTLKKFGILFEQRLVEFGGRTFKPERVFSGAGEVNYPADKAEWSLNRFKLAKSIRLQDWVILVAKNDQNAADALKTSLRSAFQSLGVECLEPQTILVPSNRGDAYTGTLSQVLQKKPSLQIAVFVIPNKTGNQYTTIKKYCLRDRPTSSQVVAAETIIRAKNLSAVAIKVAVQIQAKIGGEPWKLDMKLSSTMVVGYDSYHDTDKKNKSFGAVVSTTNEAMTRFHSSCVEHSNYEELHSKMRTCLTKAIRAFAESNGGENPKNILFYRDGVGDGQIEQVYNTEIEQIKEAIAKAYAGMAPPRLAFIIVSKRITTKFFRVDKKSKLDNPPSGTVIDDVVTLPERYDFFLVSQCVRQGTVNPTNFNVLFNTIAPLTPDRLQQFTYKLAHLYFNWPGTVRVPSVVQYAHKLAYLVGNYVHAEPRPELANLLFYL